MRIEELIIVMIVQMFCKEVVTWRSLHHPNVLPLLGVTMGEKVFAMVSEWMVNGNINEFVEAHRDVNRFELVGLLQPLTPPVADEISSDSSKMLPVDCCIYMARGYYMGT